MEGDKLSWLGLPRFIRGCMLCASWPFFPVFLFSEWRAEGGGADPLRQAQQGTHMVLISILSPSP